VLFGASNLTRGLATVLRVAQGIWQQPLDVLAALGHGRSYGMRSSFLGRALPSIADCALWDELKRRRPLPTTALITDIGNDLLYHAPVDQIVAWITRLLERLEGLGIRTTMTGLPICNLTELSPTRFLFFRSLFVPVCRLSRDETVRRAVELDDRLRELASRRGVNWLEQRADWYGIDPIHLRARAWPTAWHEILSSLATGDNAAPPPRQTMSLWLRLWLAGPHQRTIWRVPLQQAQPCLTCDDGLSLSLY
jgi:hypothetical protein